jgi:XTP/dITP diphosphohydrolase
MPVVVVATGNEGKLAECAAYLEPAGYEVLGLSALADLTPVPETGATFEANARLKAEGYSLRTPHFVLADDSGLEVDALGGAPGVRSARFAGEHATDELNRVRLLELLRDVAPPRTARFATVALARFPDGREVAAFGDVEGTIAVEPRGREGFGYDPVFVPDEGDGRTFAEMHAGEKNTLSHRGRAFRTLADGLRVVAALDEQ